MENNRLISAANGTQVKTFGATILPINKHRLSALIVDTSLNSPLIIGADALQIGNAHMDFAISEMTWLGRQWPFVLDNASMEGLILHSFDEADFEPDYDAEEDELATSTSQHTPSREPTITPLDDSSVHGAQETIVLPPTRIPQLQRVMERHRVVFGDISGDTNPDLVPEMRIRTNGPPIALKPYRQDLAKRTEVE